MKYNIMQMLQIIIQISGFHQLYSEIIYITKLTKIIIDISRLATDSKTTGSVGGQQQQDHGQQEI